MTASKSRGPMPPLRGCQNAGATPLPRQRFSPTHFVTHPAKRRRQLLVAFGDPSQRPHGIAHRRGLEQSLQVFQKRRVFRRQPRTAAAPASHSSGQRGRIPQIPQTVRSCFARSSSLAPPPRSRHNPRPSPPPPRSNVGLARRATTVWLQIGCAAVICQSSTRYKRLHCKQESRKQKSISKISDPIHLFLGVALVLAKNFALPDRNRIRDESGLKIPRRKACGFDPHRPHHDEVQGLRETAVETRSEVLNFDEIELQDARYSLDRGRAFRLWLPAERLSKPVFARLGPCDPGIVRGGDRADKSVKDDACGRISRVREGFRPDHAPSLRGEARENAG